MDCQRLLVGLIGVADCCFLTFLFNLKFSYDYLKQDVAVGRGFQDRFNNKEIIVDRAKWVGIGRWSSEVWSGHFHPGFI